MTPGRRLRHVCLFLKKRVIFQADLLPNFSSGGSLPVGPDTGLWVCLIVTLTTGIISIVLFSKLSWHWKLAVEDVEFVAKKIDFRPR